jgi:ElaB/YqjD/DUF883 family membrane-anchored ribosome-binding protein
MIPSMSSARSSASLEQELEALRRELLLTPVAEQPDIAPDAPPEAAGPRVEIEGVLRELQERLSDAADDVEQTISANPFASVAAAFLLGVLVANVMSRGK